MTGELFAQVAVNQAGLKPVQKKKQESTLKIISHMLVYLDFEDKLLQWHFAFSL